MDARQVVRGAPFSTPRAHNRPLPTMHALVASNGSRGRARGGRRRREGNVEASERLFAVVQPQLQQMAASVLRGERGDHTLEPNAHVNELFVRWLGSPPVTFADRVHFFALAAKTMRRILIDHARVRGAEKRGGDRDRVTLSAVDVWNPVEHHDDILALDDALSNRPTGRLKTLAWVCGSRPVSRIRVPRRTDFSVQQNDRARNYPARSACRQHAFFCAGS